MIGPLSEVQGPVFIVFLDGTVDSGAMGSVALCEKVF